MNSRIKSSVLALISPAAGSGAGFFMVMEIWVDGCLAGQLECSLDQPSPKNRHWEFPRIRVGRFWGPPWAGASRQFSGMPPASRVLICLGGWFDQLFRREIAAGGGRDALSLTAVRWDLAERQVRTGETAFGA